jgi:DnaJ domain
MSTPTPTAYPLQWPPGWPRTDASRRERGAFKTTLHAALEALHREIRLLGGTSFVLSSNATLGVTQPDDPSVCAYFIHDGVQLAIPCDRWQRIEANVRAIALSVEAIRGMDRWGAKHMIRAMFSGFKALPAANNCRPWATVFGVRPHASTGEVRTAYKQLAQTFHPDKGGSTERMAEINGAWAEFRKERGF